MKKYWIITYGCQMNKSDSERIASVLEKKDFLPAPKINEADLIVVNMCSIRQAAVDRVYGKIKELAKLKIKNPKLKIILTGCVLESDKNKFRKILFDKICSPFSKDLLKTKPKYQKNLPACVPISNGCNNFCAYCVVPFVRGHLICRDHKEILKEVKNTVKKRLNPIGNAISKEANEIWLLGQNVNDYHSPADSSINFANLLETVNEIPGDFKFFFTSPHPKNFSDELIDVLAKSKKFGKCLNLPVQSGDNEILNKMNRNYAVKEYKNLVKKIRKKIPGIKLSTDVIVGFPGENKKQFQNTAKLLKEIKFDWAYIAKYSPRPGTAAFKIKDNVSLAEKKKREKILRNIIKNKS